MKHQETAQIGIKLLGIYCLLQFIALLPSILSIHQTISFATMVDGEDGFPEMKVLSTLQLLTTSSTLLYLLTGAGLLKFNRKIAGGLTGNHTGENLPHSQNHATRLQILSVQLMGVYALVSYGPSFLQQLVRTTIYKSWQNPSLPFLQRFYENQSFFLAPLFGCLLGMYLIFSARGFVRLLRLTRPMDTIHKEEGPRDPA